MKIEIHPLSRDPTSAWEQISETVKVSKVNVNGLTEASGNKLRVVCMSDTHSKTSNIPFNIPDGDVFIHAGDFTRRGKVNEVIQFNDWLGQLPHRHKIVIAGNHELCFDPVQSPDPRTKLTNCIYLEDSSVVINHIKFYGSPWQPEYYSWAFNLPRGEKCLEKWNLIPNDTDVLITHGPPIGFGDLSHIGIRAGCVELLSTIRQRLNIKYHIFGHIHEGYGVTTDGKVIFINAATCDLNYQPVNTPIVFDIPL